MINYPKTPKVEDYFLLTSIPIDRKDPSKGFKFSFSEHFTKDIYFKLINILKEFESKEELEKDIYNKFGWMISWYEDGVDKEDWDQIYLENLKSKAEHTYATMLGYKKIEEYIAKQLKNIKQSRNRLISIAQVIVNIYNNAKDIKQKPFVKVAEDFKKNMSKYKILDNGRMIATHIRISKDD